MAFFDDDFGFDPGSQAKTLGLVLANRTQGTVTPRQLALATALRARTAAGVAEAGSGLPATNSYGFDTQARPTGLTNPVMQSTGSLGQGQGGLGDRDSAMSNAGNDQPPGVLDSVSFDSIGQRQTPDRGDHFWSLPEFERYAAQGPAYDRASPAKGGPPNAHNIVTYVHPDGSTEIRSGGTLAWRDHNPGNLRAAPDEIGVNNAYSRITPNHAAPLAIFPDDDTGDRAQERQLFQPGFSKRHDYPAMSIAQAVTTYAPSKENPTAAMIKGLSGAANVPDSTIMHTLSPAQRAAFMDQERKYENYTPGNTLYWGPPDQWPQLKY